MVIEKFEAGANLRTPNHSQSELACVKRRRPADGPGQYKSSESAGVHPIMLLVETLQFSFLFEEGKEGDFRFPE